MNALENPLVRSYRELLRVEKDATPEELRSAFRAMALVYHPDQNPEPNAASVFMRIREAYRVLSDADKVQALNRGYLASRYSRPCVEGLDLQLGSLFGHRASRSGQKRTADPTKVPWGADRPRLEIDRFGNAAYETKTETDASILDEPTLDLVEVIFAGKFDVGDEMALADAFRRHDYSQLPWFVLNNEGIVHFLNGDYASAASCYAALNERIPDNIIFLYRLGICHEIIAYQNRKASALRGMVLDRPHLNAAIHCFERAIYLGENRPYLPQKCMTIRKTLADLLELSGRRWRAWRAWRLIRDIRPDSIEAERKLEATKPKIIGLLEEAE